MACKNNVLLVRLEDTEREKLEQLAELEGLSLTGMIWQIIRKAEDPSAEK